MVLVLCALALFLALAVAMMYAASALAAAANRQITQERCYQQAKTLSETMEAQLCKTDSASELQNYINTFLDRYEDDTDYEYAMNATNAALLGKNYGAATMTLRKESTGVDTTQVVRLDYLAGSADSNKVVDSLIESPVKDYTFSLAITVDTGEDTCKYTTTYERQATYSVYFTSGDGTPLYYKNGVWYTNSSLTAVYAMESGKTYAIYGHYDTSSRIVNFIKEAGA